MTSVKVADRLMDPAESYRSNGYALLKGLFPAPVTKAFHARLQSDLNLTETREFLTTCNLLQKDAIEVYSLQYPPMATFLWGLTPTVSRLAGCELLPTYAYFRVYQQGDICRVHSDRDACEHSLSLMLEVADDRPWPLCVGAEHRENPNSDVYEDFGSEEFTSLPMAAGDGVLYQGVTHRHGRLEPNPNRWSAHLFLHWVDMKGPHASHAFDRVALASLQGQA
jgi:hypothetical protein